MSNIFLSKTEQKNTSRMQKTLKQIDRAPDHIHSSVWFTQKIENEVMNAQTKMAAAKGKSEMQNGQKSEQVQHESKHCKW